MSWYYSEKREKEHKFICLRIRKEYKRRKYTRETTEYLVEYLISLLLIFSSPLEYIVNPKDLGGQYGHCNVIKLDNIQKIFNREGEPAKSNQCERFLYNDFLYLFSRSLTSLREYSPLHG